MLRSCGKLVKFTNIDQNMLKKYEPIFNFFVYGLIHFCVSSVLFILFILGELGHNMTSLGGRKN